MGHGHGHGRGRGRGRTQYLPSTHVFMHTPKRHVCTSEACVRRSTAACCDILQRKQRAMTITLAQPPLLGQDEFKFGTNEW